MIALWVLVAALVIERVWALSKEWRWKRNIRWSPTSCNNTLVGHEAGANITGSNNTVLGRYTGSELDDGVVVLATGLAQERFRHDGAALHLDVDGKGLRRVEVTPLGTLAVGEA